MQTQCPVCEAIAECNRSDIGSKKTCHACHVRFIATSVPTEDDLIQAARRRSLLYNLVIPVASVIILVTTTAGAFYYSHRSRAGPSITSDTSPASNVARNNSGDRGPAASVRNRSGENDRDRSTAASDTQTADDQPTDSPPSPEESPATASAGTPEFNVPRIGQSTVVPLSRSVLSSGSQTTEADNDEFIPTAGAGWMNHDGAEWMTVSSSGEVRLHVEATSTVDFPELSDEVSGQHVAVAHGDRAHAVVINEIGLLRVSDNNGNVGPPLQLHSERPTGLLTRRRFTNVFSCSLDGTLKSTSVRGAASSTVLQLPAPAFRMAMSGNERNIAVGCADRSVMVSGTDLRDAVMLFRCGVPIRALAISGFQRFVAVAGNETVELYNGLTGELAWSRTVPGADITTAAFSGDGTLVAVGTRDGSVLVFNVEDNTLLDLQETGSPVICLRIVPREHTVAVLTERQVESQAPPLMLLAHTSRSEPPAMENPVEPGREDDTASTPDSDAVHPRILLLAREAETFPVRISAIEASGDDFSIAGHGLSKVTEVMVFRPTGKIFRQRHTIVSDERIEFRMPERLAAGSFVAVETDEGIAVAIPSSIQPLKTGDVPEEFVGCVFLSDSDSGSVMGQSFPLLLLLDQAFLAEPIEGNGLIISCDESVLTESVSGQIRVIRTSQQTRPVNLLNEVPESDIEAARIFPCPVPQHLPLAE